MKIIFRLLIIAFIVVLGTLVVLTYLVGPSNFRLLVVQSGSMEPGIKIGSIILVSPLDLFPAMVSPVAEPKYKEGEIISYLSGKETFTHRVVSIEKSNDQFLYLTKGDANRAVDRELVEEKQITGKVFLSLPFLGYLIAFTKTQMGFIALIIIPATIIVYSEILNIKEEIRKMFLKRKIAEV